MLTWPCSRRFSSISILYLLISSVTTHQILPSGRTSGDSARQSQSACKKVGDQVRFATYNTSLNRNKAGELLAELQSGKSAQAANVSAILQSIRPDVLVLNEFDYYEGGAAVKAFQDKFLSVAQAPGLEPLRYPYVYIAPVNTGVPSGRDFDHDGRTDGPADAFGYGFHPGQYGMVLLSQFPIQESAARTFQHFLYKDMPGALLPTDPKTGQPWYNTDDLQVLRLSSKSHWDVPIDIPLGPGLTKRVHMLLHHPTPPAFDGPEGRNLLRNHDEIRLFADYVGCGQCPAPSSSGSSSSSSTITAAQGHSSSWVGSAAAKAWAWMKHVLSLHPGMQQQDEAKPAQQQPQHQAQQQQADPAAYLYDDAGKGGGLAAGSSFVIAGDHNADPLDGNSYQHAILQLLQCCNVTAEFTPVSEGGKQADNRRPTDKTPPETKTATFGLRVDYVLPSRDMRVLGGEVFWPVREDPSAGWLQASDHRPVYLDVEICGSSTTALPLLSQEAKVRQQS